MIWLALLGTLAPATADLPRLDVQDGAVSYSAASDLYTVPPVRPFEPTPGFAGGAAEGDAPPPTLRRLLREPVVVEDYRGTYEAAPTDVEIAYEQGVVQAEMSMDGRMGPLDGRWRVAAADGTVLLQLLMTDPGQGRPIEGGWLRPAAAGEASDVGSLGTVTRDGSTLVIPVADEDAPIELRLHPSGQGWTGVLTGDGPDRAVRMSRPD